VYFSQILEQTVALVFNHPDNFQPGIPTSSQETTTLIFSSLLIINYTSYVTCFVFVTPNPFKPKGLNFTHRGFAIYGEFSRTQLPQTASWCSISETWVSKGTVNNLQELR
jgi:hypothetical protein